MIFRDPQFDKRLAGAIRHGQFPTAEEQKNVLVVGAGGREHAIAHTLLQSSRVAHVFVAPGNCGTADGEERCSNVDISSRDINALVGFAVAQEMSLVIVGPEQPLVDGLSDAMLLRVHTFHSPHHIHSERL